MLHLKTALETSARADIGARLTGRFYTPYALAARLVESDPLADCPESMCDPFCGDGRLILAWLQYLGGRFDLRRLKKVSLWDYDGEAVAGAAESVSAELQRLGANWVSIDARVGDTFSTSLADQFDLVITNPPWEQLKPDTRDGVLDAARYRNEIRAYATSLGEMFPGAASSRRRSIGGYTVNLARAGALLAAKLVKKNGLLQIVLPSTIFGDQVSTLFRQEFFSSVAVTMVDFYPAEAKLFSGVDQAVVTIAGRGGLRSSRCEIRRFRTDLSIGDRREHSLQEFAAPLPLSVGGPPNEVAEWLRRQHPEVSWLESDLRYGLRLGRELDETRIADAFSSGQFGIPFLKGRNVSRYGAVPADLPLIDPQLRKIPEGIVTSRVAWRDVSRPSQKRRVQACMVPAGIVTGNSLGVARFASPLTHLLETLTAVMNSFVFEVQVRAALATNHVSQGIVRRCVVPYVVFEREELRAGFAAMVNQPHPANQKKIEIGMAKAYGLSRSQFAALLSAFDKLTPSEIDDLLSKDEWS